MHRSDTIIAKCILLIFCKAISVIVQSCTRLEAAWRVTGGRGSEGRPPSAAQDPQHVQPGGAEVQAAEGGRRPPRRRRYEQQQSVQQVVPASRQLSKSEGSLTLCIYTLCMRVTTSSRQREGLTSMVSSPSTSA